MVDEGQKRACKGHSCSHHFRIVKNSEADEWFAYPQVNVSLVVLALDGVSLALGHTSQKPSGSWTDSDWSHPS